MARGLALHIGVNQLDWGHYGGPEQPPLESAEYDAMAMMELARKAGFDVADLLLSEGATRAAVIESILWAAGELSSRDILLLTFAGHGGRVPDTNCDEDDGYDETWCLYDGQIVDDELYALWAEFAPG